jgi:hypothetical protein
MAHFVLKCNCNKEDYLSGRNIDKMAHFVFKCNKEDYLSGRNIDKMAHFVFKCNKEDYLSGRKYTYINIKIVSCNLNIKSTLSLLDVNIHT